MTSDLQQNLQDNISVIKQEIIRCLVGAGSGDSGAEGAGGNKTHFTEVQPRLLAMLAKFKALLIMHTKQTRASKENNQEMKDKVDALYVKLQSLLYERNQLSQDLEDALKFTSIYESVDIYGLEEFKEKSETVNLNSMDEHSLMLARLELELKEREKFLEDVKESERDYEAALQKVKDHRDSICDKVDNHFDVLLKMSRTLQEMIGFRKTKEEAKDAATAESGNSTPNVDDEQNSVTAVEDGEEAETGMIID
ncbi:hypothetical protein MP638_005017 [Amoeboaphelidium occidentale]|nr:hypothetical protein MP638_005017 [Amoeboaphelidium occidentale]